MVQNFPGPYTLRFLYSSGDLNPGGDFSHGEELNLDLTAVPDAGSAFADIDAKTKGGILTPALNTLVEAWITLIAPFWQTITTFGNVELFKNVPLSHEADFISSYTPTANLGTGVGSNTPASQGIMTFRSLEGGILRLNFMEVIFPAAASSLLPVGNTALDAMEAFVISDASWILARDTSYINSGLRWLPGINERLFKKRYRLV